jgi:transcriptional regulator with XRE-family HTH domain
MTLNTIATNTTPSGAFVPAAPVPDIPPAATFIEPVADEGDQAHAAVGNIFESLLPNASRAAAPAANEDHVDDDAGARTRSVIANAQLRRVMGVRLVRARMLSGLSQGDIAKALGLKGQTQVSLWEMGRRMVTHVDLVRVSEVLSVSVDYLLGISDEPEKDQSAALRSACVRGVRKMLDKVAAVTVDEVARHARLVGPHAGHVRGVLAAGDGLLEAFGSFVRANSDVFENSMRGAATLQRRAQEFETVLADARMAIRAHDALDGDLRRALADIALEDELVGDDDA